MRRWRVEREGEGGDRVSSLSKVCCYEDVVIVDVQFRGVTQSASQLAGVSRTQGHNVSQTWTTDLKDKGRGKLVVRCWE